MAVTMKPVLLDHLWKEDGTNLFRVRITHKRKSRYIKTNIMVSKNDVARSGEVKNQAILDAMEDLMRKLRAAVNSIDMYELDSLDADGVVSAIENYLKKDEKFRLDFVEFGYKVAAKKSAGNSPSYLVALNALVRYFNGRHPDISEITVRNLRGFEEFLRSEKVVKVNWRTGEKKMLRKSKGGRAASLYLSNIRHVYKCARVEYNDPDLGLFPIPVDPFEYYSVPKAPASRHRDVPVEVIQLMIDTRHELKDRQRMAVDAFLISFGLCGMNAVDMYACARPKRNGVIQYRRQKTAERRDDGAEMFVKIHPCIKAIMDDYSDTSRCFDYYRRYANKDVFTTALNQGLRGWIKKYKQEDFTFYSARHSWGTIGSGKRCNVDAKIITAGLCHVDERSRVNDIYVNFDWEQLWDAQKIILDVFDWK